jgi:hypothetical protein
MDAGGGVKGSETPETVTDNLAPGRNRLLGIAKYLGKSKATHTAKPNTLRMAVVIGLHGGQKRQLVISAAPALSTPEQTSVRSVASLRLRERCMQDCPDHVEH